MLQFILAVLLVAFIVTYAATPVIIKMAKRKGIVGKDVHKPGRPEVAELGGLAIAAGIVIALLFAVAVSSFSSLQSVFNADINVLVILAILCLVLIVEMVGMVDDILGIPQRIKLLLPIVAALPLMAVKVSALHVFTIPFIGAIDLVTPAVYLFVLIPIGVMATTNVTNTFAGYNGQEAGIGAVAAFALLMVSLLKGDILAASLSAALLGAQIAFLKFNWYPAKVFPDDVGTLLIGAMIGAISIVGGFEVLGAILLLPHIADFFLFKMPNRLPHAVVQVSLRNGKLHPKGRPLELSQFIMDRAGGISERNLVQVYVGLEMLLAAAVIMIAAFA
ncbi:Phospho-N-acetylmuramoyl-pentapeptide-transferase [uncultured archaeon]|nr:Phospho-N-acetylmuramoyl-pentapeptide-transferase [uncultured archaeon]